MPAIKRTFKGKPRAKPYTRAYGGGPMRRGSVILGNLAGVVRRDQSTLATYPGPFQNRKIVTFEYQNSLVAIAPGAISLQLPVAYNDLFDFDRTTLGSWGNKQPLYYDSLLSASGPYRAYKVKSWVCTFTFVNAGTNNVSCFALPPTSATSEIDSLAEADNMPGVVRAYATAVSGYKNMVSVTTKGTPFDVFQLYGDDSNTNGPYNNSPGSACFGGLFLNADSGLLTGSVAVHCEMVAELAVVDALVS